MAKCECCGGLKDSVGEFAGDVPDTEGLRGALFSLDCVNFYGQQGVANRIRSRRAKAEQPRDTIPAPPIEWAESVHPDAQPYVLPPQKQCRECSRPERPITATHDWFCVYCNHSKEGGIHISQTGADAITAAAMLNEETHPGEAAARARMSAADRKATPRATAESRMLALPHPWECGGEDEP